MFSLTPGAAAAIRDARLEAGAPDDWGIRFYAAPDGLPGITFDFVDRPEDHDIHGGTDELRTYVDAVLHLDIGDAIVDREDVKGIAGFVIRPNHDLPRGSW